MHLLKRLGNSIYRSIQSSAIGTAFTSYDAEQRSADKSFFISSIRRGFKRNNISSLKHTVQIGAEESIIVGFFKDLVDRLLQASVRQYGIFVFSMGLYTLLIYLIGRVALPTLGVTYIHLIVGIAEMLTAIPMLSQTSSMYNGLCNSRIADFVLFRVLGIRKENLSPRGSMSSDRGFLPFILGTFLGILSFGIGPLRILGIICTVVSMCLILMNPESGLVILISFLPVLWDKVIYLGILYILLCYLLKVIRGKRTFKLELNDWAVLFFGIITLLSGIFSINAHVSFRYCIKMTVCMCAYFLIINMIRSKPWLRRITVAVVFSAAVSVICGLIQKFAIGVDFILVEEFVGDGAVRGTFGSPKLLAQYLVLYVFYLFSVCIRGKQNIIRRTFFFLFCVATVLCIYYTMSPLAIICFTIAAVLYFLLYSNRTVVVAILALLILPFSKYIFPSLLTQRIGDIIAGGQQVIYERIRIWKIALVMARDNVLGGSGGGSFSQLYNRYATEGIESLASAENIYLQFVIEMGIFGLIGFLIIVFIFSQSNFSFFTRFGGGPRTSYVAAGFSGVFGFLLLGITENVWQEPRIVLAFWIIMALTMAVKRQMTSEQRGYEEYLLGGDF